MVSDASTGIAPGEVVGGKYRVESILGQGGLGVVYRAVQLNLGRTVALKMMLPEAHASADGLARFIREAELARRLEHPNTVRLYDVGEAADGAPFIVLEYLKGRGLDNLLRIEGALLPSRVAHLGAQALRSLMEAHALGIVHRDIKPSNLFICDFSGVRDFVKVLDFGIAKIVGGSGLTMSGRTIGTPAYMSPEQVRGAELSPACDLYALGLVLAEAIANAPVFSGASGLEIASAQLSEEPPPLAPIVVDSMLGPVICRATQKDASLRYQSAGEMLEAIEALSPGPESITHSRRILAAAEPIIPHTSGSTMVASVPVGETERFTRSLDEPPKRQWLLFGGAFAGAVVVSALSIFVISRLQHHRAPAPAVSGHAAAAPTPTLRAIGASPKLSTLTPKILRERLERMGLTITHETRVDSMGARGVQITTSQGNLVQLLDYTSESLAASSEVTYKRMETHYLRDGPRILMVVGLDAARLLEQLAH